MINQTQKNNCRLVFNELLDIVESLSKFRKIRRMSLNILSLIMRNWNNRCAICGGKKSEMGIKQLDGAHIIPAEEGGENCEGNLLPLCRREKANIIKAGGNTDLVGCHQLYDNEGIWSRKKIRRLKRNGLTKKHNLKRPQSRKLMDKEQIEFLISMRRTGQANKKLKELLNKYKNSPLERLELLILQLRCARRRKGKVRAQEIKKAQEDIETLYQQVKKLPDKDLTKKNELLERIEYEKGMIAFAENNFKEASKWLRRYKSRKKRSTDRYWLINEVQACAIEFEYMRIKKNNDLQIKKILNQLEQIIPELDRFILKNIKKLSDNAILNTWRVTARLHLPRMKAYLNDADAMSLVHEAEEIRDCQDAKTGWKSYTVVLLLHAKGECYRSKREFEKALQMLSLAARKILTDKYKNYEYLDNVLEGLLKIPNKYYPNGGQDRQKIEQIMNQLTNLRCI